MEAVLDVAEGRLRVPDNAVRRVFAMIRGERKSRLPSAFGQADGAGAGGSDAVRQR